MNVASLELCKELYELSGWADLQEWWVQTSHGGKWSVSLGPISSIMEGNIPAYDLGYLLRKLPDDVILKKTEDSSYRAYAPKTVALESILDNTPEDAACKLAIELFKQGVLKP